MSNEYRDQCNRLKELIKRMGSYMVHDERCPAGSSNVDCTCGFEALMVEIRKEFE